MRWAVGARDSVGADVGRAASVHVMIVTNIFRTECAKMFHTLLRAYEFPDYIGTVPATFTGINHGIMSISPPACVIAIS